MDAPKLKPISATTRNPEIPPPVKESPKPERIISQPKKPERARAGNGGNGIARLLEHYGCAPIQFAGSDNASYERHLIFDNVIALEAAGPRERFEAFARSVRDVLSHRWVRTEETYARENPKRIYYLSMEFLIGRSLANNVTNLLLDPLANQAGKQKNIDWPELLEQDRGD